MPGMSGVEAIRQMTAIAPLTRVLVLTASHEDADVIDAIMSGACGYLVKDSSIRDLLDRNPRGGERRVADLARDRREGAPAAPRGPARRPRSRASRG